MFEHLSNCHGEWQALFGLIASAPFIRIWISSKKGKKEDESR